MSVIHIAGDEHCDVEVWLDCEGGGRFDGLVIGVGDTRAKALLDAEVDLLTALDAVRIELAHAGVITYGGSMNSDQENKTDETPSSTPAADAPTTSDQADGAGDAPAEDAKTE